MKKLIFSLIVFVFSYSSLFADLAHAEDDVSPTYFHREIEVRSEGEIFGSSQHSIKIEDEYGLIVDRQVVLPERSRADLVRHTIGNYVGNGRQALVLENGDFVVAEEVLTEDHYSDMDSRYEGAINFFYFDRNGNPLYRMRSEDKENFALGSILDVVDSCVTTDGELVFLVKSYVAYLAENDSTVGDFFTYSLITFSKDAEGKYTQEKFHEDVFGEEEDKQFVVDYHHDHGTKRGLYRQDSNGKWHLDLMPTAHGKVVVHLCGYVDWSVSTDLAPLAFGKVHVFDPVSGSLDASVTDEFRFTDDESGALVGATVSRFYPKVYGDILVIHSRNLVGAGWWPFGENGNPEAPDQPSQLHVYKIASNGTLTLKKKLNKESSAFYSEYGYKSFPNQSYTLTPNHDIVVFHDDEKRYIFYSADNYTTYHDQDDFDLPTTYEEEIGSTASIGVGVNAFSGAFTKSEVDLSILGRKFDFNFDRTHSTNRVMPESNPLGSAWASSFFQKILTESNFDYNDVEQSPANNTDIIYIDGTGRKHVFKYSDSSWICPTSLYVELSHDSSKKEIAIKSLGGISVVFYDFSPFAADSHFPGRLKRIEGHLKNSEGIATNKIEFGYTGGIKFPTQLTTIRDTYSREIKLSYYSFEEKDITGEAHENYQVELSGLLREIEDFEGRKVTYTYNSSRQLVQVEYPKVGVMSTGVVGVNKKGESTSTERPTINYVYALEDEITSDTNYPNYILRQDHYSYLNDYTRNQLVKCKDARGHTYLTNYYFNGTPTAYAIGNIYLLNHHRVVKQQMGDTSEPLGNENYDGGAYHFDYKDRSYEEDESIVKIEHTLTPGASKEAEIVSLDVAVCDPVGSFSEIRMNKVGNVVQYAIGDEVNLDEEFALYGDLSNVNYKSQSFYDDEGRLIRSVNEIGLVSLYSYLTESPDRFGENLLLSMSTYDDQVSAGYNAVNYDVVTHRYNYVTSDSTYVLGSAVSANNQTTTYTYDQYLLKKVEYPEITVGMTTEINGEAENDKQVIKNSYTYNNYGLIKTSTSPNGTVTTYEYFTSNDPFQGEISSDNGGFLAKTSVSFTTSEYDNPNVNVTQTSLYKYDKLGRVVEQTDSNGNVSTFQYNNLGQVVLAKSPQLKKYAEDKKFKPQSRFYYDLNGNLTHNFERLGNYLKSSMNPAHVTGYASEDEIETIYTYDTLNQVVLVDIEMEANHKNQTKYVYDASGLLTETVSPKNYSGVSTTTKRTYNTRGLLISEKINDGSVDRYEKEFTYNELGNLSVAGYANTNHLKKYEYDSFGRVVYENIYNPNATDETYHKYIYQGSTGNLWTKYTFKKSSSQSADKVIDVKKYRYDELDRLYEEEHVIYETQNYTITHTLTTEYGYNRLSQLIRTKAPGDRITDLKMDPIGRTRLSYDPNNNRTYFKFDKNGNVIQIIKVDDNSVALNRPYSSKDTFEFDEHNRIRRSTDLFGYKTELHLDSRGLLTTSIDPEGNEVEYVYNSVGNVRKKYTEAWSQGAICQQYVYDAQSQMYESYDGLNKKTTYAHDGFGRLVTTTFPDSTTIVNTYYNDRNLLETVKRQDNTKIKYEYYDHSGLVQFEKYIESGGSFSSPRMQKEYAYNDLGQIRNITQKDLSSPNLNLSGVIIVRDSRGSLITYSQHVTKEGKIYPQAIYNFSYDQFGRVSDVKYSGGRTVRMKYDAKGLVEAIATDGYNPNVNANQKYLATYEYLGRLVHKKNYANSFQTKIGYDRKMRLMSIKHVSISAGLFSISFVNSYDKVGNVRTTFNTSTGLIWD